VAPVAVDNPLLLFALKLNYFITTIKDNNSRSAALLITAHSVVDVGIDVAVVVVRVGHVVVVVRSDLLEVRQRVVEGWQVGVAWARSLGPGPLVLNGLGKTADDWHAFVRDRGGISVLVAHHDEGLAVYSQVVVKLIVAVLQVVEFAVNRDEFLSVLLDLPSVVIDVGVVLVNVTIVLIDMDTGVVDTVSQGSD